MLAVFGIGAAHGRRAGAGFLCGHLLGDVVWCGTALVAIVGAREIGSTAFDVLGRAQRSLSVLARLACGAGRVAAVPRRTGPARQPFWHGILFGLTNPKAYPVAVATFTALLSSRAELLTWSMLPWLILLSFVGVLSPTLFSLASSVRGGCAPCISAMNWPSPGFAG